MSNICSFYEVNLIGADAGEGAMGNGYLREQFGHKVMPFRYSGRLAVRAKWDPKNSAFTVHKTTMIDNFFAAILRDMVLFSEPNECEQMFNDICAVYEDVSEQTGEKRWVRPTRIPDDSLHSLVFGWLASMVATGQLGAPHWYAEDIALRQLMAG